MKYGSISTPLSIPTVWTPLSASLKITHDEPLQQWYYDSAGAFVPSRVDKPLVLVPDLRCVDTETGTVYTLADLLAYAVPRASVKWYQQSYDGDAEHDYGYTEITGMSNMVVAANGVLRITRNLLPAGYSRPLRCVVEWQDPRNDESHRDEAEVIWTCMGIGESPLVLSLLSPAVVRWNPLSSADPVKTVTAEVRRGGEQVTEGVTFQWYKVGSDNSRTLIDDDAAVCAAYVSGQGTSTLTVNMDYLTSLTVECRFSVDGVEMPDRRQVRFMWDVPAISCEVYTPQGESIRETSAEEMEFRALLKSNGVDIPSVLTQGDRQVELSERINLTWFSKSSHASARTMMGTGQSVRAATAGLRQTGSVNTVVNADVYLNEALLPLVDGNGKYIVDKALASGGKIVVGRVAE